MANKFQDVEEEAPKQPELSDLLKLLAQPRKLTELEQLELEVKREQLEATKRERETRLREQALSTQAEAARQAAVRREQMVCSHHRKDGSCRAVLTDDGTQHPYILCQKCLAIIRPDTGEKHTQTRAIYDNKLYYALLQECETDGRGD